MKRIIDGTPDEWKLSCPVWSGGKSGDYIKGLPIAITAKDRIGGDDVLSITQ